MHKTEFEAHFQENVAEKLIGLGFDQRGKSLSLRDHLTTLTLFRLGGRLSRSGSISIVLCFRHSFLRDLEGERPTIPPESVFDYPYKFRPLEDSKRPLRYRPQNGNFEYERVLWDGRSEAEVLKVLDDIAAIIAGRFLPWAQSLSAEEAMLDIENSGENAWCERRWLEDYGRHLAP